MTTKTTHWQYWQARRNKVFSSHGGWQVGVGVHNCGFDQMKDLAINKNYFQVLVLNCVGKLPSARLGEWLDSLFTCISWPDPRIWCNTMGSLAGTLKCSISSGVASGILSADSKMFGSGDCVENYTGFIQSALSASQSGLSAQTIIKKHRGDIPGFARPLASGDERVSTMTQRARTLGFAIGEHEQLMLDINAALMASKNESVNIGGYFAAFMSDQGYTPLECRRILTTVVHSGVHACHVEEQDRPPLSFMPIRCDDINYQGVEKRKVDK
ncbi:hypothetical protein HR060_07165 [Catenovulum sp. SM1970]|uniref:hypothetical protein n=1 Tax=Marinifaba aquimaris TaxID=2741323 RepID=UPI0015720673|nr:hypothetical protein [Marinifaba aquimaris]NTS76646.1 hypothetical protein [Marinifaba aquimaris]